MVERRVEGPGLNLTEQVRDGILNHTGPEQPATLEGRIVRLVDRVAYINHDIDDAVRAGVLRFGPAGEEIASSATATGPARIDTLVHDLVEHSEQAGTSSRARRSAARCCACGSSCSNVYRGPTRSASAADRDACCAPCSTTTPTSRPRAAHEDGPGRARVVDWLAGMTDRFALRSVRRPQGSRRVPRDGALHQGLDRARPRRHRHGRAGRPSPTCGGWVRWTGSARSTTSARRRSRSTRRRSSTTASAAARGATRSASCSRPRRSTSRTPSSCWPSATTDRARARGRGSRGREAPAAGDRLLRCSTATTGTTPRSWESAEAARRATTWPGAAWGRRCCASSASATRPAPGTGSW